MSALRVDVCAPEDIGRKAAELGVSAIKNAIEERGEAFVILATGASQFDVVASLALADLDWSKVTFFHLDEYVGLNDTHKASFRGYMKLPTQPRVFHFCNGDPGVDPKEECSRLESLIQKQDIDVAFIGIGENAHLAFNDPPCDMETERAYIVVQLDQACRQQQVGEGWFASLADVPEQAISMSMKQILRAKKIVCTVPDERKATAVHGAVEGPMTVDVPASFLRTHPDTTLLLDPHSSSKLSKK